MKKTKKNEYDTPLDPANDKDWRNHNLANVTCINDLVYNYFIQAPSCLDGIPVKGVEHSCADECVFECCNLRIHDKINLTVETKSNNKFNILISRAELVWNYHNKVPFIFRTGKLFGIVMHHKNSIHWDDRYENLVFRDDHQKVEGRLRSIEAHMRRAALISEETKHPEAKKLLKHLKGMYKRERDVSDSTIVDRIIREQMVKLILEGKLKGK